MMECREAWSAPGVSLLGSPRPRGNGAKFAARALRGCRGVWAVPHSAQGVPARQAEKIQAEGARAPGQVRKLAGMVGREPAWMCHTSGTRPERGGLACLVTPAAQAPRAGPGSEGASEWVSDGGVSGSEEV